MRKIIQVVFGLSFIFYLYVLVVILFLNSRGNFGSETVFLEYIKSSSNLVPFETISTYFKAILDGSMNIDIPIKNLFGNIVLFLPMGIYLPFFIKKLNKIILFSISMIALLFIVEATQLITRRGQFDIDDIILNMLGTMIGFGIWKTRIVQKILR